jgi:hypothetical protein
MNDSCNNDPKNIPIKERMKTWQFWKPYVYTLLGAMAGYGYYYFIGCSGGSCPITSNPYVSIAFGGLFGYFLVNRPCSSC